jgi:Rps23 Pro-64 3,4-dihydroxylase Tpa1-like proline 4-hydroxylase
MPVDSKVGPITYTTLSEFTDSFLGAEPYHHVVLDNFLREEIATAVAAEFPPFEHDAWRVYNSAIEVKKLLNHWDKFGPETYRLMCYLNSREFVEKIEALVGCRLYADFGLNGGGLHSHKRGGKLNVHLDYSIHPKLELERRINLIIYLTPNWQQAWGGKLGLWYNDETRCAPGALAKSFLPLFNRAVLFDTTQNSWHGLPEPISCPPNVTRNSVAVYYLCEPRENRSARGKALFAPYKDQENNPEILELIRKRSEVATAHDVYGDRPEKKATH